MDGTLACPSAMPEGEGTVIDITLPVPASQLPQETNRPDDNLSAFIRNGRVMVSVKQAAGSRNDGIYAIEGINGKCIGLFTGDIGQETNPFLCMLMDDGGVELLNYHSVMGWSDIEPGHLLSSGRLPEMTDIVSFVPLPLSFQSVRRRQHRRACADNLAGLENRISQRLARKRTQRRLLRTYPAAEDGLRKRNIRIPIRDADTYPIPLRRRRSGDEKHIHHRLVPPQRTPRRIRL